jgi:two-component system sensor histidine kinase PilS (NtrC family)
MNPADIDTKQTLRADNRSLTWYLICRTAVITFLLGGAAVFYLNGSVSRTSISPFFFLIGISYAEALASAFLLKKTINLYFFTQLQIIWDLLFVTALILLTGGVESVFSFAYLLVVVSASFLLSRRLTILAAASAVILFWWSPRFTVF